MAFNNKNDLVYERKENGLNITIDDGKSNSFIGIREVRWNPDQEFKIDLRRYVIRTDEEESERPGKGISFSTEDAVHQTVEELATAGFGHTNKLMEILQNRDDFDRTSSSISPAESTAIARDILDSIFEGEE